MSLPLEPYSVIDLTRARSGRTCVRQLAEMSAVLTGSSGSSVGVRVLGAGVMGTGAKPRGSEGGGRSCCYALRHHTR
jgi:hypothetical protein